MEQKGKANILHANAARSLNKYTHDNGSLWVRI